MKKVSKENGWGGMQNSEGYYINSCKVETWTRVVVMSLSGKKFRMYLENDNFCLKIRYVVWRKGDKGDVQVFGLKN